MAELEQTDFSSGATHCVVYLASCNIATVRTEGETGDVVLGPTDEMSLLQGLRVVDDDRRARRIGDEAANRVH